MKLIKDFVTNYKADSRSLHVFSATLTTFIAVAMYSAIKENFYIPTDMKFPSEVIRVGIALHIFFIVLLGIVLSMIYTNFMFNRRRKRKAMRDAEAKQK